MRVFTVSRPLVGVFALAAACVACSPTSHPAAGPATASAADASHSACQKVVQAYKSWQDSVDAIETSTQDSWAKERKNGPAVEKVLGVLRSVKADPKIGDVVVRQIGLFERLEKDAARNRHSDYLSTAHRLADAENVLISKCNSL